MKRGILLIFSALMLFAGVRAGAQEVSQPYFPLPAVPQSLPVGRERANYFVEHYWDHCPWKSAFSAKAKMAEAFQAYAQTITLAAPDTVFASIDRLIDKVKKRPDDMLALARMAEATFYSDTALVPSDEAYRPFALAASQTKKLPEAERAHFARQVSVMDHSAEGTLLPAVPLTLRDGSTVALNDTTSGAFEYLLIFETPGSMDGMLARTKLAANYAVSKLVKGGALHPIFIYPGTPDATWWQSVSAIPAEWTVAAMPQAADYMDLRITPAIYIADSSKHITRRFMSLPLLIATCQSIVSDLDNQQPQ